MPEGELQRQRRVLVECGPVARHWHGALQRRLEAAGYAVGIAYSGTGGPDALDLMLALEGWRGKPFLAGRCERVSMSLPAPPDLVIALYPAASAGMPVLSLLFAGTSRFEQGVTAAFRSPRQIALTALLDGRPVGRANPMLDDRVWLTRVTDNALAGAISLLVQSTDRFFAGRLLPNEPASSEGAGVLPVPYLASLAAGLWARAKRRLNKERPFYWQVAYRQVEGPGVAETGTLEGTAFTVLEDDGARFYADPFVLSHEGQNWLFVEEFPYALGRGVISAARQRGDGSFETPKVVLEEPHHLSYPQVFKHGSEVFMLPESAGARELVLYRAARFPDQWVRDTVLLADRDINDATLLFAQDRYWLFGCERSEHGSASDTLVVFSAANLRGPYRPHGDNPIAIDLAGARPGGAFVVHGGALVLPVQNGADGYGSGLGLMRLDLLSDGAIGFDSPKPVTPVAAWPGRSIHTLNRVGKLEVVDSSAPKRR